MDDQVPTSNLLQTQEQQISAPPTTAEPPIPAPPQPPEDRPQTIETTHSPTEAKGPNALNLCWSFGLNRHIPVLNLTDHERGLILYVCAHTGVLYDYQNNSQYLLQGHPLHTSASIPLDYASKGYVDSVLAIPCNAITCTCVSEDKRWVATADIGEDSMVIIWDSFSGVPVRTIFDPHPGSGVVAIGMTPDAKYIATLSSSDVQTLSIWDWTTERDTPLCTTELQPAYGQQTHILFNPEDTSQIVTNSDSQVLFYFWREGNIEHLAPPLSDEDFNKPVGKYSQSIFQSNTTRALTATSLGNLVVWDSTKTGGRAVSAKGKPDKKALKLVKLQERGINVITTTGEYIVTGDIVGHVKFFDQTLKLLNWYQDFHLGPVNSLSFAYAPDFADEAPSESEYPADATIKAKKFAIRDFVVGTTTAVFANVRTDGTDVTVIHREHDAAVHAIAPHPFEPKVAIGSYSGCLKIWDYEAKDCAKTRYFEKGNMIRCCSYDPKGQYLAVGFLNGSVRVLDAVTLEDDVTEPFRYARDAITHIAFSHDSKYFATADAEFTVSLFCQGLTAEDETFVYLGRHRAHYKLIVDIMFGIQLDSDKPRLLSLGEDRVLVEYDLPNSSRDNLCVLSSDRIEQSAVPMCMTWYPPITKESFIVTANDQYKFKLYNSTTKMCRKTLLGPTYGTPLQKIEILSTADPVEDKRYMAYITSDKIGMVALPVDGNPHNSMALISHPGGVSNLACSHDGCYLFTAGGGDAVVHMWEVNLMALEAQSALGGEGLVPFYGLLDGGRDGELYAELEDYFYYAQIRSQGVDTTESREVSTHILLSEVPFVMRAMGFYPSEQEIEDMLNEVKYSEYVDSGEYKAQVDLGEFIRLYVNHRPAFGLQSEKLQQAFETLGFSTENGPAIDRGDMLDILQSKGEHMTEYELAEYLTTLLGFNQEGGSSELQDFDTETAGDIVDEKLPQDVTADFFSDELLGFSMYADVLNVEGEGEGDGHQTAPPGSAPQIVF